MSIYSIWTQYCINATWYGHDQPVLRKPSLLYYLIFIVSHLPLDAPEILLGVLCQLGPVIPGVGPIGRSPILLEDKISFSIKIVSRGKHAVLYNCLVDSCAESGL